MLKKLLNLIMFCILSKFVFGNRNVRATTVTAFGTITEAVTDRMVSKILIL